MANRIRNGTMRSMVAGVVIRNRKRPQPADQLGTIRMRKRGSACSSSARTPTCCRSSPARSPPCWWRSRSRFIPRARRVGYEISVPPPATEFTAPAKNADPNAATAFKALKSGTNLPAYTSPFGAGIRRTPLVFNTSASENSFLRVPTVKWPIMADFQVIQPETTYTGSPIRPLQKACQNRPSRSARIAGTDRCQDI